MGKTDNYFMVNNQQIPWSFFHRVKKRYGLQKTQQVFYYCRAKKKIVNYISAGMKKEWFAGDLDMTPEMEAFILKHFDKQIPVEQKRKGPQEITSISDILKSYSTE